MVDGTIARRTNSVSRFGSQLDTVADMVFVVASLINVLPAIDVPLWLWIWGGAIALIKVGNIIWGYVARRQFVSIHTIMNKVTGFILFLLPLTLSFMELDFAAMFVCLIATISAIQEGFLIIGFFRS
jgi:CDP-diacylglycerol--glycerol-3-phosphate 3-phosphatidyltransferase